uniref:Uncharacterized protein n=1 Tax=Avena sativa TaxID=4498 RepID=A0ACD5VQG3_AVESA
MAFADTASRKLLHGAGGAMARVAAADGNAVGMSFGLGGLWQLIVGLFGSAVHLLVIPFEVLWGLLQTAVAGAAHLLLLPFEALWHLLQATAANAAAGISLCFDGLWNLLLGFVANLLATVGNAAHVLVAPFEALCRWLQIAAASVQGIIPSLLATLSSAAHKLVLPFEAFGRWMQTIVADAAAGISIDLDGVWPLIRRSFASVLATLAGAADELVPALEAFWRWIKTTAAVALPFVMCIALVISLVALVWYCLPLLSTAAALTEKALMSAVFCVRAPGVAILKAVVQLVCWTAHYLHVIAMAVGRALSYLLPVCRYCCQCCASATMKAPGAAGFLISRAAFVANPRLYFQILRSAGGGSVVASAVFSTPTVASAVAAPVATLFRA